MEIPDSKFNFERSEFFFFAARLPSWNLNGELEYYMGKMGSLSFGDLRCCGNRLQGFVAVRMEGGCFFLKSLIWKTKGGQIFQIPPSLKKWLLQHRCTKTPKRGESKNSRKTFTRIIKNIYGLICINTWFK